MNAHPLSWPEGWPRTPAWNRTSARFSRRVKMQHGSRQDTLTVSEGLQRVLAELERMGIDRQDVIVSTNVPTRLDGLPRSGAREPDDPGAAVYWQERAGTRRVLAIDQYDRVADNLAAIAATFDALRSVERHGGSRILERAFTGFATLPAPGQPVKRTWRQVFGVADAWAPTPDQLRAQYRRLAAEHHPDRGGSAALMSELNVAYEEAQRQLR